MVLEKYQDPIRAIHDGYLSTLGSGPERSHDDAPVVVNGSMFERVPGDLARAEFRQRDTLGAERRHWFRAKFGAGRFRLFFRFRTDIKVIVYVWVNSARSACITPCSRREWRGACSIPTITPHRQRAVCVARDRRCATM